MPTHLHRREGYRRAPQTSNPKRILSKSMEHPSLANHEFSQQRMERHNAPPFSKEGWGKGGGKQRWLCKSHKLNLHSIDGTLSKLLILLVILSLSERTSYALEFVMPRTADARIRRNHIGPRYKISSLGPADSGTRLSGDARLVARRLKAVCTRRA